MITMDNDEDDRRLSVTAEIFLFVETASRVSRFCFFIAIHRPTAAARGNPLFVILRESKACILSGKSRGNTECDWK